MINESNAENSQAQFPNQKMLKDKLKPIFGNDRQFKNENVDERIHPTKVNTKINDISLK